MNIQEATVIELTEHERSTLEGMTRSAKTEHGLVERARIVLLAAQGRSTRSIAAASVRPATIAARPDVR